MMKIAIDFHNVLADLDTQIRTMFFREYGIEVKKEDVTKWELWDCTPIPKKVFWEYIDFINGKGLTAALNPLPTSQDSLRTLMCYYPCEILTATPDDTISDINKWLKVNGYPKIKVNSVGKSKALGSDKMAQEFDIFVDDSPYVAEAVSEDKHVIIFDQPWNRHVNESKYKNVHRAYSWEEVIAHCHTIQGVL